MKRYIKSNTYVVVVGPEEYVLEASSEESAINKLLPTLPSEDVAEYEADPGYIFAYEADEDDDPMIHTSSTSGMSDKEKLTAYILDRIDRHDDGDYYPSLNKNDFSAVFITFSQDKVQKFISVLNDGIAKLNLDMYYDLDLQQNYFERTNSYQVNMKFMPK